MLAPPYLHPNVSIDLSISCLKGLGKVFPGYLEGWGYAPFHSYLRICTDK